MGFNVGVSLTPQERFLIFEVAFGRFYEMVHERRAFIKLVPFDSLFYVPRDFEQFPMFRIDFLDPQFKALCPF